MSADSIGWTTCSEDQCQGIRLHAGGKCLAHAERQDLDAELRRLAEQGTIDARGVTLSAELLNRILGAAPHDEQQPDRPRLNKVTFDRASFGDHVSFGGASFGERASFDGVTFGYGAWFESTTFGNGARFAGAGFGDRAWFGGASFGDGARFDQVQFNGSVCFSDVKLGDWARLGPVVATELTLRQATFGRAPDLVLSADRLRCQHAKFPDGARLRLRWAEVALDGTDFGRPSVLEAAPALEGFT